MPHPERDNAHLRDMLAHAEEAIHLIRDKSLLDVSDDRVLQLALTHLVEIIGEAATRVSAQTQDMHAGIPWPLIVGMRNRLIHGYDAVDLEVLWKTVVEDLPELSASLRRIL